MRAACSRALLLGCCLALLQGCAVRLAYNNADRLVAWQASEYVDLDRSQRAWLRARVKLFLYWHRREQLPEWASALRRFELALEDDVAGEELQAIFLEGERWSDEISEQLLPALVDLLLALDESQREGLPETFAERNAEWNEDYEGLDDEAQRRVWQDEMREGLDDWVGALNRKQNEALERAAADVVPDNSAWISYRERWQGVVMDALLEGQDAAALTETLHSLMLDRERWYTPEYARTREINDAVYQRFTLELLAHLDTRQHRRLSRRVRGLAEDFEALAAQSGSRPVDPGPAPRR